jgi:histone acetyltransferase (RNA polymerase elongator complex component)
MEIPSAGKNCAHYSRSKIIPIFLPNQGCPNRCIFCNQKEVTGTSPIHNPKEVYPLIQHYLETIQQARQKKQAGFPDRIEVAFYGGNFTGMAADVQREFLQAAGLAVQNGSIDGIRISTRPDYISKAGVQLLASCGVKTVEIGVQSLDVRVLQRAGRTYSEDQVAEAMSLLHEGQFSIGLHLMVGLPEESLEGLISTVEKVIRLSPHFVRIHPTLVIKDTELERMYRQGDYTPLSLEQAVEICKELTLRLIKSGIPVARIGLQSIPEMQKSGCIVAGPFHPALGELVASSIAYDRMRELLAERSGQGRSDQGKRVVILVPARELSIFIGQHRQNLYQLRQLGCSYQEISILPDKDLEPGSLRCMV